VERILNEQEKTKIKFVIMNLFGELKYCKYTQRIEPG
jgi:hypothetical protein